MKNKFSNFFLFTVKGKIKLKKIDFHLQINVIFCVKKGNIFSLLRINERVKIFVDKSMQMERDIGMVI